MAKFKLTKAMWKKRDDWAKKIKGVRNPYAVATAMVKKGYKRRRKR